MFSIHNGDIILAYSNWPNLITSAVTSAKEDRQVFQRNGFEEVDALDLALRWKKSVHGPERVRWELVVVC